MIEKVTGGSVNNIKNSRGGHMNVFRSIFIYLSRNVGGYKIKDIAQYLSDCKYPAVSLTSSNFEKQMIPSTELQSWVAICRMELARKAK